MLNAVLRDRYRGTLGIVGEQGRTEIHSCENFEEHEEFMNVFRQWYISQGYEEWPEEEQNWVAVRLPVNPVHFDDMSAVLSKETADRQEMTAWLLDEAFSPHGSRMGRRLGDRTAAG